MTVVSISTPHHQLKSYLATPEGDGPWPGVIVLHDIFGLTDVTRGHADWLAKEGYLAVALDLFSWGGRLRCIRALMADLSAREGAAFDDVDAARQWLEGRQDCTGKTGVISFCATGGFAILLAAGHGFSAVAPNYGPVPNDIDAIMNGACPVVASFGGRDWPLKGAAARLQSALERNKIEHDVKEYPDAGHSFLDEHKGLIGVLGVVIGAGYKTRTRLTHETASGRSSRGISLAIQRIRIKRKPMNRQVVLKRVGLHKGTSSWTAETLETQ